MKVFESDVEVGDAVAIGGLSVFPLTSVKVDGPPYLTGPEAFEAGLIEVGELDPPEVPHLAVTNIADVPILLVEGEMLIGGDQNRTMNVTVLCPARTRIIVPVSCVEAGRWGARRTMHSLTRHAPGSLRAVKTANLESRTNDVADRRSDQGQVWDEVDRQSFAHCISSETAALDDIQEEIEARIADQLEQIKPTPGQVGVVCIAGDKVVGLDLFDKPSTLEHYLRGIIAGHVLDAPIVDRGSESIDAIERFLAEVDVSGREIGQGVGLGDEVLLHGVVTGVGLTYENRLVHLAAFPVLAGGKCEVNAERD
jgi:hypothetical protein